MAEELTHNRKKSRFEVRLDEGLAGFAHYKLRNGVATFDHTEISPEFGGRGLGSTVVRYALEQAVAEGWKIRPTCPFVVAYLKRHHDFDDSVVS